MLRDNLHKLYTILFPIPKQERPAIQFGENPIHTLFIETSTYCNLKCPHCSRAHYSRQAKHLSPEDFKKILDNYDLVQPLKPSLVLHGLGEPTLNPSLTTILGYAAESQKFSSISFTSNFCAVPPERYDDFFDAGLTKISCSFDSLKQSFLDTYRPPTKLDRLISAFEFVAKRYPASVTPMTVVSAENADELPALLEYFMSIGIKHWKIQRMMDFSLSEKVGHSANIDAIKIKEFVDSQKAIQIAFFEHSRCEPFTISMVTIDGAFIPCSVSAAHEALYLGNMLFGPLSELLTSSRVNSFRQAFATQSHPICKNCPISW